MPPVIWIKDANTLTFDKGTIRGPRDFEPSGVVTERLAGGAILSYDLGIGPMEVMDYVFPHLTKAKRDALETWYQTTVKQSLLTFTHEDQSESPSFIKTVRMLGLRFEDRTVDPANPRATAHVRLQKEPA